MFLASTHKYTCGPAARFKKKGRASPESPPGSLAIALRQGTASPTPLVMSGSQKCLY